MLKLKDTLDQNGRTEPCVRCSGDLFPPSPPAEKASARGDQARQSGTDDGTRHRNAGNGSVRSCPEEKRRAGDCGRGCDLWESDPKGGPVVHT
jgi:hypothetical protein